MNPSPNNSRLQAVVRLGCWWLFTGNNKPSSTKSSLPRFWWTGMETCQRVRLSVLTCEMACSFLSLWHLWGCRQFCFPQSLSGRCDLHRRQAPNSWDRVCRTWWSLVEPIIDGGWRTGFDQDGPYSYRRPFRIGTICNSLHVYSIIPFSCFRFSMYIIEYKCIFPFLLLHFAGLLISVDGRQQYSLPTPNRTWRRRWQQDEGEECELKVEEDEKYEELTQIYIPLRPVLVLQNMISLRVPPSLWVGELLDPPNLHSLCASKLNGKLIRMT